MELMCKCSPLHRSSLGINTDQNRDFPLHTYNPTAPCTIMSNTLLDEGVNVSFMSMNATRLNPSSLTDRRVIVPTWSATIDGPADKPADAIGKLFRNADDRTSDSIVYDPTDCTISLEGSAQRRELKDYCGDGVDPFGTEYQDQIVPGVLGAEYTASTVTDPITPPITPVAENNEEEVLVETIETTAVLPGHPPPSPPKTPPTPPYTPPDSPPITPLVSSPPTSLPRSPPISPLPVSLASSTSTPSASRVSPPLSSPMYSPPIVSSPPLPSAYSPPVRSVVSGDITPPVSPVVVSPPTPPSVKVAQTSYFPPVSP